MVANFELNGYTISATANPTEGGTIEGANTYTYGQTATLTATASEGYNFINWTENDEIVSTDAEYSFVVTADRSLVANFEAIPVTTYTITITVTGHGTVTPNGENGVVTVNAGDDAVFTIAPEEGYEIDALIVDGNPLYCDPTGEVYTFTAVADNHTLTAIFVEAVSADIIESGSMSVYPNPNNGMFTLSMESIEGDVTCQIVNANGSIIETREVNANSDSEISFDCNVPAGVYFVRIISGDKTWTERVVIE